MSARSFDINKFTKQGNIKCIIGERYTTDRQVLLHGNKILSLDGVILTLSSCGWKTVTTKTAINNALKQLNQPYYISQEKFNWFVYYKGEKLCEFKDGIQLNLE